MHHAPNSTQLERHLGDWMRAKAARSVGRPDHVRAETRLGLPVWRRAFAVRDHRHQTIWNPDWPLHRYDALFLFAIGTQALFLWKKLETWEEARVILLFHLTGTAMEWFKVSAGSWAYPEPGLFKLMGVPLFSGFMYASVGSYMARVIRIFNMRFAPYPPFWMTVLLAAGIYVNFFAHHFLPDIRLGLFAATDSALRPHPRVVRQHARHPLDAAAAGGPAVILCALGRRECRHRHRNLALFRSDPRPVCQFCQIGVVVSVALRGLRHRHAWSSAQRVGNGQG